MEYRYVVTLEAEDQDKAESYLEGLTEAIGGAIEVTGYQLII